MIRLVFLFVTIALPSLLLAQLQENFSDGNLSANPEWQGDINNFTINDDFQLQLAAPSAGNSFLFTQVDIPDSTIWEIFLKLDFSPSTSNLLRIYLQLDSDDITTSNGYFLEIGESGSNDALKLFRKDGDASQLLASGSVAAVGTEPAIASVRVTRTKESNWALAVDYSTNKNYVEEVSFFDDTYKGAANQYFALFCKYSASRTDKFFFDDISIASLLPDTKAPELLNVIATSANTLDVFFNEDLAIGIAETTANYNVANIGQATLAEIDATNKKIIHLTFPEASFVSGQVYSLEVSNVEDLLGNAIGLEALEFTYFDVQEAEIYDILIHEFMADPSPSIGMPDAEFIELYNRSDKVIDLLDFALSSVSTPQALPHFLLQAGAYVLICDDSDAHLFEAFGDVIALKSFPTLSNAIDEILLEDPNGNTVHFVPYNLLWYRDFAKTEGGWTLEMINPNKPCTFESNWRASINISGGTPGVVNSIFENTKDDTGPELIKIFPTSETQLSLTFDKSLDEFTAIDISNYTISNGIEIGTASLQNSKNNQVELTLNTRLEPKLIYELKVETTLTDCVGNQIDNNQVANFGLAEIPEANDIVINEILFNPFTKGVDFIELYNNSNKIIDIKELVIGNFFEGEQSTKKISEHYQVFPKAYVALTASPSTLDSFYNIVNAKAIQANFLPSFPNKEGNVTIYLPISPEPVIIDAFDYSEDFHHPLLDDTDGVSLERISPTAPTQDADNWHSAAKTAGFATPGYVNSQFTQQDNSADELIRLENESFSPDEDGFKDFLLIHFNADQSGYLVNMKIYDANGRLVKDFLQNELLGTREIFKWDGTTNDATKARLGIYILWIELFSPDGTVNQLKRTCVVAGRLD